MTRDAYINHEKGIHARVAAMIVQKARELEESYEVRIYLKYGKKAEIPATNMMPLVSLQIKKGDTVIVEVRGRDAKSAVDEMVGFLESDFQINDLRLQELDSVIQDTTFTAEQVFFSMVNGLLVIDDNEVVTIFNPAAERILGLSAADVIGKKIFEVLPNSRLHVVLKTREAELGKKQVIGESVIITNRTPIVVDGKTRGAMAIFEDISALEQTVGELREVKELKERLHLVLESVEDGICVVNKEGEITYVNPAYIKIVGQDELIGKNVFNIAPEGFRCRVLKTGKPVLGEISQKANGVRIVANVNPIVVDGEVAGVVSTIKDLTEVRELMEKLNQITARAEYLEQELIRTKKPHEAFNKIIGSNSKLMESLAVAGKAADTSSTVMIRGESGTGKELVAEGIHYSSSRREGPFIRVNCAAIPGSLLESELFGHERGAFTGAIKRKLGKFELAHQGTIFLDEIGDMDKQMQVKLLRVIQERKFERVGGEETIAVDVRIIAATNRGLEEMVEEGSFREDLYYRLNVIPVFLPPLRDRRDDIPVLVDHFISKFNQSLGKSVKCLKAEALEVMSGYGWPGNVRELENVIERLVTLTDSHFVDIDELPGYLRRGDKDKEVFDDEVILSWEEYERQIITRALEKYGTYNRAGKVLGLTHKTIANKARKYGIEKKVHWEKGTR